MISKHAELWSLTENQFQIGRVLFEADIDTSYKDASDEDIQNFILDDYFGVEYTPSEIRDVLEFIDERSGDIKFYDGYIELDDSHVDWNITTKNAVPEEALDSFQQYVDSKKDEYIITFENKVGQKLYFLGRSGRHTCVEYNWNNFVEYYHLVKEYNYVQEQMLEDIHDNWEYK